MTSDPYTVAHAARLRALLDALAAAAPTEDGRPARPVSGAQLQGDYACGVIDLLSLLGAVCQERGSGAGAVSVQAGWALGLLRELLDAGTPLIGDWQSGGVRPADAPPAPPRAPDLLAAIELRRQQVSPGAAPLRQVEAAVALISRRREGRTPEILLVYDQAARAWQLPGGRCEHSDATPEMTLRRELHEELRLPAPLQPGDIRLEAMPVVSDTRMSPTFGLLSCVTFHMYRVTLRQTCLPLRPGVRWVSLGELEAGYAGSGENIAVRPLSMQAAQAGMSLIDVLGSSAVHSSH